MKEKFRFHGIPKRVIFDRVVKFMSKFSKELFAWLDTNLDFITSYHPQMDGQTQWMNHIVEDMLQMYVRMKPTKWEEYLFLVEFSYINGYQTSAKMSPFEELYQRKCRTSISWDNTVDKLMIVGILVVVIDVNLGHWFWTVKLMKAFEHEWKFT